MKQESFMTSATICWDCAKATGGCRWSDELKPVKGWTATFIVKDTINTYKVTECPEFVRDALNFGTKRLPKNGDKNEETIYSFL